MISRIRVSLKYATLSLYEYDRLMAVENMKQAYTQQKQLQLNTSWNGKNAELFEYEMYCAATASYILWCLFVS